MDKITTTSTPAIAVDLANTKLRLVLDDDFTEHDAIITEMIHGATALCEAYSGHQFMQRNVRMWFDDVPVFALLYDLHPVVAITAAGYVDADGNTQVFDMANCTIDLVRDPAIIRINNSPRVKIHTPNVFWIDATVGYGASGADADAQRAAMPRWAINAINAQVAAMYENREDKILNVGNTAGNGNLIKASEYMMHPFKRNF